MLSRATAIGRLLVATSLLASGASAQSVEYASSEMPRFLYVAAGKTEPVVIDVRTVPALSRRLSVNLDGVALRDALETIASQAGLRFNYSKDLVPLGNRVHLKAGDITVAAALTEVLLNTELDVLLAPNHQIALVKRVAVKMPQAVAVGTITGRVVDSTSNEALAGATISVEGTRISVTTGVDGRYTMSGVPVGNRTISARRLGYSRRSRLVTVVEGAGVIADFALARTPTQLTEIVVTPTGDRQRLEVGNAIGTIKADSLVPRVLVRNLSDLLTAGTPGVIVSNTTGAVGAPSKVRIRGQGSVYLNNDPIVIVDGVRLMSRITRSNSRADAATLLVEERHAGSIAGEQRQLSPSALDDIDPNLIESVDLLRGPSAAALYGTEAANGVIVIKTKRGGGFGDSPFRFSVLADAGTSHQPRDLPLTWFGWGRLPNGTSTRECRLTDAEGLANVAEGTCIQDSVTAFNAGGIETASADRAHVGAAETLGGFERRSGIGGASGAERHP